MGRNVKLGCLCALGCETLFGFSYLFTKNATNHASALSLLGWRFLIAAIVMSVCVMTGTVKVALRGKGIKPLLIVALFSPVIYFVGETVGINMTTASESGAFLACIPIVSLIASSLILDEKPVKMQVAGIVITLIGVLITVFAVGLSSSFSVIGYVMLTIAVISYALYSVYVEKASAYTGAEVTYVMLLAGAIVFVLLSICEAIGKGSLPELIALPFHDTGFLSAVLYQGIGCSVLAFFMSNIAIANIGVNRTSSFIGIATVVSIIAGIVLLGEPFSAFQIIGAVLIIAGVYIANAKLND